MMFWRYINLTALILLAGSLNFAQAEQDRYALPRAAIQEKIDQKQRVIDFWDGKDDQTVQFRDPVITQKATHVYISVIDSIQNWLEVESRSGFERYQDVNHVLYVLNQVNLENYQMADYFTSVFENILSILRHKEDPSLMQYLLRHMEPSVYNVILYKDTEAAAPFLKRAAQWYPNEVLREISYYSKNDYAREVVEEVAKVSPQAIKKYFTGKNLVYPLLSESNDSVVKLLQNIYQYYGAESKVYYFADLILQDDLSADMFKDASKDPRMYLNALMLARQKSTPIGAYDLERELSVKALEEVRKVNDLHDLTDSSKRFAAVKGMGAFELYTLMVYSPEEIFTSTFNGLFERLLYNMRLEGINGYYLLELANYNKFRTFIKLCAGYNTLGTFLSTMPEDQSEEILRRFVTSLNPDDGNLSEAVNVADTFGSLEDRKYLNIFEEYLRSEYLKESNSSDTKLLYGLLLKLLYRKMGNDPHPDVIAELDTYTMPVIDAISVEEISGVQGNVQMHFFFDDEDGLTSFSTFIASFKNAGFAIEEKTHYVVVRGKGKNPVIIYANKPLSEREGQSQLIDMMHAGIIQPTVIVHRGHSYYAMNTIQNIPPYAKVVFLGSCGGYHNLTEVIKRAPEVHIISSKQIGTYVVNNTLLVEMSKIIQDSQQIGWTQLWKQLDGKLKGSGKGYERFLDYVPPHKNMGAIFILAYNRISAEDKS